MVIRIFLVLCAILQNGVVQRVHSQENNLKTTNSKQYALQFGSCKFVINPQCPDPDVTFFMYSTAHPDSPEQIIVGKNLRSTNLARTAFDPNKPSKLIIHGYNSDMFLNSLTQLRIEYLKNNDCNVFTVDWSPLNQSPCYPAAVWNARHVGECSAQLIQRLREMGAEDIHVIGFSLGAQITNYLSLALRPYVLPRITGLDPALPGYVTANNDAKLDKSDAEFVDVYHTNAFMQGKAEECGHVDFYFNGGSVQPGCAVDLHFFSCNHHRAPIYYAESINSQPGFWGWPCPSYFEYIFGRCPPQDPEVLLGEFVDKSVRGVYMVLTNPISPFAIGRFEPPNLELKKKVETSRLEILKVYKNILDVSGMDEETMYEQIYKNGALQRDVNSKIFDDFVHYSHNESDVIDVLGVR